MDSSEKLMSLFISWTEIYNSLFSGSLVYKLLWIQTKSSTFPAYKDQEMYSAVLI